MYGICRVFRYASRRNFGADIKLCEEPGIPGNQFEQFECNLNLADNGIGMHTDLQSMQQPEQPGKGSGDLSISIEHSICAVIYDQYVEYIRDGDFAIAQPDRRTADYAAVLTR